MTFKLFIENSYLKEIEAKVLNKKCINEMWHIKLDRTIFYPHLVGGQTRDFGSINGIEVMDVYEESKAIYHILQEDISASNVKLIINWDHRFDMMQQHSGQHLLSSCFFRLANAETLSSHLGEDSAYIDINLKDLTIEEVYRIESLANKIVYSNFKIKSFFLNEKEVAKLPLRKLATVKEDIRIVEIENIDYSPCGGTHVNYTGEIGIIKIKRWYKNKNNMRVEFVCGKRALEDYNKKTLYINELNQLFSSKDKDIIYKSKSVYYKKVELKKEVKLLRGELCKYKGDCFFNNSISINGINYIIKTLEDIDLTEINQIAQYLNKKNKLIQIYGINNKNNSQFLISRSNDLDIDLKDVFNIVNNELDLEGGGNYKMVQGEVNFNKLEIATNKFIEIIKTYFSR